MEELIKRIARIQKMNNGKLHQVELFSDGSGSLDDDDDEVLFQWDNLDDMKKKFDIYLLKDNEIG